MGNELCIVLRTVNYNDYDRMITLFSPEKGKLSAMAKRAQSLKSTVSAAAQPLCCGVFSFKEIKGRLYIDDCEIKKEYLCIAGDYDAYMAACTMVSITEKLLDVTDEFRPMFVLLVNCIDALSKGVPMRDTLELFLTQLTFILGIPPAMDSCASCGDVVEEPRHFSSFDGGVLCEKCAKGVKCKKITKTETEKFARLAKTHPKGFEGGGGEDALLDVLIDYLRDFGEIPIKTEKFFK